MADPFRGRRWWVVGASEGLGAALARAMDAEGATLVLSARRAAVLTDLASGLRAAEVVAMDVTDEASVAAAVEQVGPVDAILYCAGAYEPMAAPDWQPEEAVRIAEVNFIGALRVLGRVVPAMAAVTQHLGFGITFSTTYEPPFAFARRMSTLDHLTKGRVGWNIVTSYLPNAARNFSAERW